MDVRTGLVFVHGRSNTTDCPVGSRHDKAGVMQGHDAWHHMTCREPHPNGRTIKLLSLIDPPDLPFLGFRGRERPCYCVTPPPFLLPFRVRAASCSASELAEFVRGPSKRVAVLAAWNEPPCTTNTPQNPERGSPIFLLDTTWAGTTETTTTPCPNNAAPPTACWNQGKDTAGELSSSPLPTNVQPASSVSETTGSGETPGRCRIASISSNGRTRQVDLPCVAKRKRKKAQLSLCLAHDNGVRISP